MAAFEQVAMKVNPVTYRRVTSVKKIMEHDKQRQVTYSEVVDELVRGYEMLLAAAAAKAEEEL